MELRLRLEASDLADEALQEKTRQLRSDLNRRDGVGAEIVEGEDLPGSMGDPITLGTLAVSFASPAGVMMILGVLKMFLDHRADKLRKVVAQSDRGPGVTITLADLEPDKIQATLERLQAAAGSKPR